MLGRLCRASSLRATALSLSHNNAHTYRTPLAAAASQLKRNLAGAATFLDRDDVTDRVLGCVKSFEKVDPEKVNPKAHFLNDLGLDSLDAVEVVMSFEDEFNVEIADADAEKIHTCDDAIKYILAHPAAK